MDAYRLREGGMTKDQATEVITLWALVENGDHLEARVGPNKKRGAWVDCRGVEYEMMVRCHRLVDRILYNPSKRAVAPSKLPMLLLHYYLHGFPLDSFQLYSPGEPRCQAHRDVGLTDRHILAKALTEFRRLVRMHEYPERAARIEASDALTETSGK